jgi:predicted amidohydrolase
MQPRPSQSPERIERPLNRRQALGAVGAAAGALALAPEAAIAAPGGDAAPAGDATRAAESSPGAGRCSVRVVAVSSGLPFHDHRGSGVNLDPLRQVMEQIARERPDFVCFPEICACGAGGFDKGIEIAPEIEPYAEAVGRIAREFDTALVVPLIERRAGRVYNSVPIVDRGGRLAMVYRKNYPTTGELEAGITPGDEVPVADCDGVRVGAAVCFDANFDHVAAELERQRARLVFWPSMYWGGELLRHWALRYGFAVVAAYGLESAVIDMNGQCLARQGQDTFQVRRGHLPPWAVADIQINRELYHLDFNQDKLPAIREKYAADVAFEVLEPEGFFLMASRRPDLPVEAIAAEFDLETLRDYLARSVRMRNERLAG